VVGSGKDTKRGEETIMMKKDEDENDDDDDDDDGDGDGKKEVVSIICIVQR